MINFDNIKDKIIGDFKITDYFSIIMHSNNSPVIGDHINIDGDIYDVDSVEDDTTNEEYQQGLQYNKVWLNKVSF